MTKRLLVADDSPTIHKVVRLALADEDIEVESVDRADDVVERATQFRADLVLADASMPGSSGYQICERLKSRPELQQVPVVLLVATGETYDEREAARVGCDGYLHKPFDMAEFIEMARRLLKLEGDAEQEVALVTERTRESFLGSQSILDVFGPNPPRMDASTAVVPPGSPAPPAETPQAVSPSATLPAAPPPHVIPFPGRKASEEQDAPVELPDEILDAITERVIRQMSPDIIREVAWEVIPDLAEIIIRQYLEERGIGR